MESVQSDSPPVKFELSPRNKLYAKIGENLSEDEVKSLRALLTTDRSTLDINKGQIEKASPHEIFNMLEDGGKIGEGNLGLLKELLTSLGKAQLAKEADDLEKEENLELASISKRSATEDASSTKRKRMSCDSEGTDDSESSAESDIGCRSSSSQSMETGEFENAGDLTASARCSADGSTLETVGDVHKRIEHLRRKIAKLTRYPKNISKTKSDEVSNACKEMGHLVKVLEEQSTGELTFDIALHHTEAQDNFQEICETGTLKQEIEKEVKHIMRSTSDDIANVKPGVQVDSANVIPERRATIKVTAEDVELADNCKLEKDSAVRRLFKYLVQNAQKLRPITRYLNEIDVQVTSISYGSIDFECLCLTPESAVRLQEEYDSKKLQAQFQRVISSLAILADFGIKTVFLAVDLKFEVSAGVTSSSNEEVVESLQSKLAQMEVNPQRKSQFDFESKPTSPGKRNMARLRFGPKGLQDTKEAPTKQERRMRKKWEARRRKQEELAIRQNERWMRQTLQHRQQTGEDELVPDPGYTELILKAAEDSANRMEPGPAREVAKGVIWFSQTAVAFARYTFGLFVPSEAKPPRSSERDQLDQLVGSLQRTNPTFKYWEEG